MRGLAGPSKQHIRVCQLMGEAYMLAPLDGCVIPSPSSRFPPFSQLPRQPEDWTNYRLLMAARWHPRM